MQRIAFAIALLVSLQAYHETRAQDFWYQPYGTGYGFNYVIPVGGGVGLNTGIGYGLGEPTIGINLAEFGRLPNSYDPTTTEATVANDNDENQQQVVKHKPKKKAALPVLHSKPIPLKYVAGTKKLAHK